MITKHDELKIQVLEMKVAALATAIKSVLTELEDLNAETEEWRRTHCNGDHRFRERVVGYEKDMIRSALILTANHQARAAKILG